MNIFDDILDVPNVTIETKIISFKSMTYSVHITCFPNNHNKDSVLELFHTHPNFEMLYDKLKVDTTYKFKVICQYMINNNSHVDKIYDIECLDQKIINEL